MTSQPNSIPVPKMLPHGHVGMMSVITTEIFFLASLIVVYLAYLGKSISGPTPEELLSIGLASINTVAPLASSVTIIVALKALRACNQKRFLTWLLVTGHRPAEIRAELDAA